MDFSWIVEPAYQAMLTILLYASGICIGVMSVLCAVGALASYISRRNGMAAS